MQIILIIVLIFIIILLIFYIIDTRKKLHSIISKLTTINKDGADTDAELQIPFLPSQIIKNLDFQTDKFIDQSKRESEQILRLEQYRREYIGNVAHELKTPIFNIQGYVETLIDGALHDSKVNGVYLNKARQNIDRMVTIIDDLDTISLLESGKMILDYESFDLVLLAREVIENQELNAKQKDITVSLSKNYIHPILVNADRYRIRQVLSNLIGNSIKYGRNFGSTEIAILQYGDRIEMVIKDSGIGIADYHLPHLFDRFYRIDKGRSREQGGSGLGLSIVKHIIDAHGHSIRVKSKVGEGTSFSFTLSSVLV